MSLLFYVLSVALFFICWSGNKTNKMFESYAHVKNNDKASTLINNISNNNNENNNIITPNELIFDVDSLVNNLLVLYKLTNDFIAYRFHPCSNSYFLLKNDVE